jgi:hypothetical protein
MSLWSDLIAKVSPHSGVRQNATKKRSKAQKFTWKHAHPIGSVRNKNETAVTQFKEQIRRGICLADSEAQGSAVRQSLLCYRLHGGHSADAAAGEPKKSDWEFAPLMIEQIAITIHLQRQ